MRTAYVYINRRCPLKCRHCRLGSLDARKDYDEALSPEVLRETIGSIDATVYDIAALGGGEPSLNPELISVGIAECAKAGLMSAIISAPIWARNKKSAEAFLNQCAGLDVLVLGYDQFHLESLTFKHYRNAAIEAVKKGIGVAVVVAYTDEQDRRKHLGSLDAIRHYVVDIIARRVVPAGNATQLENGKSEQIQVDMESDLVKIPRGCLLGNVGVDNKSGLHGCCWSINAEDSPFSLVRTDGESLSERFRKLESSMLFQAVRQNGFLDSLSPLGRKYLTSAVQGRRFSSECDICLSTMKKGYENIWAECYAGSQRRQRKKLNRLEQENKGYVP